MPRGHVALEAFLPGPGGTTVAMLGAGETLGWQYSARSVAATRREMSAADPEFGRELVTRRAPMLRQRLQAERFKRRELHNVPHPPPADVRGEPDEETEVAVDRPR